MLPLGRGRANVKPHLLRLGALSETADGEPVETAEGARTKANFVETPQAAGEWLKRNLKPGDAVLLKASRGVRLEQALTTLTAG